MAEHAAPEISVILVTPRDYSTLRGTMAKLRDQTIHDKIEIIIIAPNASLVEFDDRDHVAFHSARVLQYDRDKIMSSARAAGIRRASAPVGRPSR